MANPIVQQINVELESLQKELEQFKSTVEYLNLAESHVKKAVDTVNYAETHFNKKVDELKHTYDSFIKLSDSVSKVISKLDTINFPERLDSIEGTVKETISNLNEIRKSTLDELKIASETITKSNFDGKFKELQKVVDTSVKANEKIKDSIISEDLGGKITLLSENILKEFQIEFAHIERVIKLLIEQNSNSISELNLPDKIKKLELIHSKTLEAIQDRNADIKNYIEDFHSRFDVMERQLMNNLNESNLKITEVITSLQDRIMNNLNESNLKITEVRASLQDRISENFKEIKNEIAQNESKHKRNNYITWLLIIVTTLVLSILLKI